MPNPLVRHFHNVKAHGHVLARPHQKGARDIYIALLLMPLHCLGRCAELRALPRFYFAEHHRFPVARDDVRFAEGGAVVPFQNFVTQFFQVSDRSPFPCPSECFFMNVLR